MYRSRSLTYFVGAILALLTLYTLFAPAHPRNGQTPQSEPLTASDPALSGAHTSDDQQGSQQPIDGPPTGQSAVPLDQEFNKHASEPLPTKPQHPPSQLSVADLIQEADYTYKETLSHQTYTLRQAAEAYRKRRGRHPPPGFDRWYEYATRNDAIMVEEYFDQIYHDLNPFWAITPKLLRTQARGENMAVEVKDGQAKANNDWFWHEIWGRMINEVAAFLPDMYIAMNPMDESRLFVQWETINEYMKQADAEKKMADPAQVINQVQGWGAEPENDAPERPDPRFNGFNVYRYARSACPPQSPARQVGGILLPEQILGDYRRNASDERASQYFDGRYVLNYTKSSDYCEDATTGGLHGALMQPLSVSCTDVLMPMFGGSKFHSNNEILLPAPMYWNEEIRFGGGSGGDKVAWSDKTPTVIWRGTATGGRSKPYTWHLFHRHRFVAIANGTKYDSADENSDPIFSPFFREGALKNLHKGTQSRLGKWLNKIHDVSFTNLVCDENEPDGGCWYTNDHYKMTKGIEFVDQFTRRYVPDIDGNSFSGRYRAFLLSNSLPLKSTIYREWHDSRLVAWKHFVPMNNRFSDYYSLMEYFLGNEAVGLSGHDEQARMIASDGRAWAEKVLRKVDMQIYTGRLLLEYARLTDDKRDVLGWVDDLLSPSSA